MASGIYCIKNKINGKLYIGSSKDLDVRAKRHFYLLKHGKHYNGSLQGAYNKYGEDNLCFENLISSPKEYLIKVEQWFIDNLKPEYNRAKLAYATDNTHISEQGKEILRQSKLGINNPNAKLTAQQVLDMRASSEKNITLAKAYGISPSQVSLLKRGKTYTNIT
jgi:group I intron endonuclease